GTLSRREYRSRRCPNRSVESGYRLRKSLGIARRPVGKQQLERHQRRHLQISRRWQDMDSANERAPGQNRTGKSGGCTKLAENFAGRGANSGRIETLSV